MPFVQEVQIRRPGFNPFLRPFVLVAGMLKGKELRGHVLSWFVNGRSPFPFPYRQRNISSALRRKGRWGRWGRWGRISKLLKSYHIWAGKLSAALLFHLHY